MSRKSAIEWTHSTWNPVTGCTKVSAGCDHCYAERFSERFRGVEGHPFESGFDLTLRPERLGQPTRWRRPQLIFVNSMSDLFHRDIPVEYIRRVFDTMEGADWHVYQVLTKRELADAPFRLGPLPRPGCLPVQAGALEYLAGRFHRKRRGLDAPAAPETDARLRALRFIRAVARSDGRGGSGGYSLGHRGRGERAGHPSGSGSVGARVARSVPGPARLPVPARQTGRLLLQAVGRAHAQSGWEYAGWTAVAGVSGGGKRADSLVPVDF